MSILWSKLKNAKYGLEAMMTLRIVTTVIIVSILITFVTAYLFKHKYEEELNHELVDAMTITEKLINIEITKVETASNTAAKLYNLNENHHHKIDSILYHSIKGNPMIVGATVMLEYNKQTGSESMYTVYNKNGEINSIDLTLDKQKFITNDENWIHSYCKGEQYWSMPWEFSDVNIISYSTPITNEKGKTCGIYIATVALDSISEIVVNSKVQSYIDISIIADNGNYIVEPDDNIKNTDPKHLIIKKNRDKRLGWNFVFSTPRDVIMSCVWKEVFKIIGFVTLLILALCVSIFFTVKYVARPFVKEQKAITHAKASMDKEVSLAANVQRKLLTEPASMGDTYELNASLTPAKNIGGDLYDYTVRNGKLYFCIGDVSGKGMPAALFMGMTTVLFRHTINEEHLNSPSEIISEINNSLSLENPECMFVTFFAGILDLNTGQLDYCNAGHNTPMLNDKYINDALAMPMGIDSDMNYETETITLNHGDKFFLYTDGVTEAMNVDGVCYGEERLSKLMSDSNAISVNQTIKNVTDDIIAFAAGAEQHDDITMLCIKYK